MRTPTSTPGVRDADDVRAALDRAGAVGVRAVVTIADDLAAARWATQAAEWDDRVYAAVALHPTRADALTDDARAELERLAAHPRVVAVGETGMDLYWPGKLDGCAEPDAQREAFAWHIDLAKRTGKPLMIHNRDADAAVLDVLAAEGAPDTVIFHCFSSDAQMARTCIEAGWLLSLAGTVSFKNAHALREAARLIPGELLLVETDAPFLTPHPYRERPTSRIACRTRCARWPRSVAAPPRSWRSKPPTTPSAHTGCVRVDLSKGIRYRLVIVSGLSRPF
ncbi:hypothetical protein MLIT_00030 [Mycolicibacterium litorale]|uniref:TatD DNase family protein n=1 Tax=Mycolicibacterium litorale TaxID=758802 RepID=A0AAD1IGH9_9MYCO|nr:hypothetical protein MLIT_00030 [Mycolicibacterium litorale]